MCSCACQSMCVHIRVDNSYTDDSVCKHMCIYTYFWVSCMWSEGGFIQMVTGPRWKALELISLQGLCFSSLMLFPLWRNVIVPYFCIIYSLGSFTLWWLMTPSNNYTQLVFASLQDCPRVIKNYCLATVWASELSTQRLFQDHLEASESWIEERTIIQKRKSDYLFWRRKTKGQLMTGFQSTYGDCVSLIDSCLNH